MNDNTSMFVHAHTNIFLRSYEFVHWMMMPRGLLRNESKSGADYKPIQVCAILQTHDLRDLLGEPWQFDT